MAAGCAADQDRLRLGNKLGCGVRRVRSGIDQRPAQLVLNQAEHDRLRAGNHRLGDHHGIRTDGLHRLGVDRLRHADAPQRHLDHGGLPDAEAERRHGEHHDRRKAEPDDEHARHVVAEQARRLRAAMDLHDGRVAKEGHGDGRDEARELADHLTDDGRLRRRDAIGAGDRKDVLDDRRRPVVSGIEGAPTQVEAAVGGCRLREGGDGEHGEQHDQHGGPETTHDILAGLCCCEDEGLWGEQSPSVRGRERD